MANLSHHESHILALVLKWQPTTAYFVRKMLGRGLATTFSSSPGSVYPAVERLKARGYLVATVRSDGRKTEVLSCSEAGKKAVRSWITTIDPVDMLPEDPWRTRIELAETLSPSDMIAWLKSLRAATERELEGLMAQSHTAVDQFFSAALDNAMMLTQTRIAWVDRTIARALTKD